MTRAQLYTPNIKFENDERLKEFVVIIWRDNGVNYGGVDGEVNGGVERIPFIFFSSMKNLIFLKIVGRILAFYGHPRECLCTRSKGEEYPFVKAANIEAGTYTLNLDLINFAAPSYTMLM